MIQLGIFFFGNQRIGVKGVEQGIHSFHITDQAVVEHEDHALAACGCVELMEGARRSDPDISFLKGVGRAADGHGVLVSVGHDDFHGRMPVERKVLRIFVVVNPDAVKSVIGHCLVNSV